MDYATTVAAIITFIEAHIQTNFDYLELEKAMNMSLSHIRDIFQQHTGMPLSQYIRGRRIAYGAFDLVHTNRTILDIGSQYGFSNPDTFTRAFRSITGVTPSQFRKEGRPVGNIMLYNGLYGISHGAQQKNTPVEQNGDSMVLYGVPKAEYGVYGVTPFPICLKSVANYLGIVAECPVILAQCGGAFRLTWDISGFNGGNVDISHTFNDANRVYSLGVESIGRNCSILLRNPETQKKDFVNFLKHYIDQGIPVIAKGIVGPPETCIITGYRKGGAELLGWSFFQENVAFGDKNIQFDANGYFICSNWWENPYTIALIGIDPSTAEKKSMKEIMEMAVEVLAGNKDTQLWKGLYAYDGWKNALQKGESFTGNYILQTEGFMCHADAVDSLADSRGSARIYFTGLAEQYPPVFAYKEIARCFGNVESIAREMAQLLGGWQRGEEQLMAFAKGENRERLCSLIDQCKDWDEKALRCMEELINTLV